MEEGDEDLWELLISLSIGKPSMPYLLSIHEAAPNIQIIKVVVLFMCSIHHWSTE